MTRIGEMNDRQPALIKLGTSSIVKSFPARTTMASQHDHMPHARRSPLHAEILHKQSRQCHTFF
jgi:hypothetical protein